MDAHELVERARHHIITAAAIPDGATHMAETNLAYGLAKMHWVQEALGYAPDAAFVAAPDMTTPRQPTRWRWGMGAGGILSWGDGDRPLVFLDQQVSTSAALVGGLDREPDPRQIVARAHHLRERRPVVRGFVTDWGFDSGNHFINTYRVHPAADEPLPPYVFVLHGGDAEVKRPTSLGIGLDYEQSAPLRECMTTLATPLGPARVLTGQTACDFYAMYLQYEEYCREKQLATAAEIFGAFTTVSNEIHHGFADQNTANIACYRFSSGSRTLYPVVLRPDLPAYLVRGEPNIDPALLPCPHLPEAVRRRVHAANALPHGGGCTYPEVRRVADVISIDERRYYVLETAGGSLRVVDDLHMLPHAHRGLEAMDRLREWRLGRVVAELQPLLSLTT